MPNGAQPHGSTSHGPSSSVEAKPGIRLVARFRRSIRRIRRGTSLGVQLAFLCRTALWAVHVLARRPVRFVMGTQGARMELPPVLGAGAAALYILRDRYEPEVKFLDHALRPGDVFVDGGANLGIYTVLASSLVGPSGRVLSFEPGAVTYERLQRSIAVTPVKNVTAFRSALSDTVGTANLFHTQGHVVSYSLAGEQEADVESEVVETLTIDEVIRREDIDRLDFIKLDIEGAEELALRGAASSIDRWKPLVLFEVMPEAPLEDGLRHDGAWTFLQQHGYSLGLVQADGRLVAAQELRVGNNIAVPEHRADLLR